MQREQNQNLAARRVQKANELLCRGSSKRNLADWKFTCLIFLKRFRENNFAEFFSVETGLRPPSELGWRDGEKHLRLRNMQHKIFTKLHTAMKNEFIVKVCKKGTVKFLNVFQGNA